MNKFVVVRKTDNNIVEVISNGKQGVPGKSAYQIAVLNGFEGTEKEWLDSLKGDAFTYDDFTSEQLAQLVGPQGKTGYYYTPSVNKEGILSWTNSGNLSNPDPVNIKGPQGDQGIQGERGDRGYYFTPFVDSDGNLSWTNNGNLDNPISVNIKGDTGKTGPEGPIGPQGPQGNDGATGPKGDPFIYEDFTQEQLESLKGPKGDTGEKGDQGLKGNDGVNATITNVTASIDNNTGTPSVIVSMGGTSSARTFNFDFKNLKGSKGDMGEKGLKGDNGISVTNAEINFNNGHLILTLE